MPLSPAELAQRAAEADIEAQQRLAAQQAKQAARDQKAAADTARKAELSRQELDMRAQGMTPVTTADGNLHPDPLWEQKQAEKAAKAAQEQQAAQLSDQYTREGRKNFKSKVTGLPTALESDEMLAARKQSEQAARIAKIRSERHSKELETLKAEVDLRQATRPPLSRDRATGRPELELDEKNGLPALRQQAHSAILDRLTKQASEKSGTADWIPWNEKPTEDAEKATERLARLQTPADLTDDDLKLLDADDATKPISQKIRQLRAQIAADDEDKQFYDATQTRIQALKLKAVAPEKYAVWQRQRRASMTPEQLQADLDASASSIQERVASLQQQAAPIQQRRALTAQKLDTLAQQAAERRQRGLMAGEIVTFTRPDGTTENWPADLAATYEREVALNQEAETQEAATLEQLQALQKDIQDDDALYQEGRIRLNEVNQVTKVQKSAAFSNRLRFTPGMEQTAAEVEALQSEADLRAQDLADMHPDGVPEEAQKALQNDIQQRQQAILAAGQQRQQAAAAAYQGLQAALKPDKNSNSKADIEVRPTVIANLAEALQVDPQEAERLLSDMETLNWDASNAQDVKEKTPEEFAAKAKAIRDSATVGGFVSAIAQTAGDIWNDKPSDPRQTRLLSNGAVVVNPTITAEKDYTAAVNASGASPEAKAEAIDRFPDIRQNAGARVRESFQELEGVYGKAWIQDWLDYDAKRPQDVTPEEWAMRFTEDRKNDSALRRVAQEIGWSFYKGGNQLRQQVSGLTGGITGSETLMQDAQWAVRKAQAMQTSKELYGSASENFLRAGLLEMTPEVATSILPAAGGAKLAQWGIRGLAATGAGARLFPALAAVLEGSNTAAQAVKATQTLTRAGLAGASLAGGSQTYGAQISDIYGNLRRQGIEHPDALRMAQMPAILSAGVTAALTALGGASGVERLLVNPASAKALFAKQFETQMKRLGFVGQKFFEGGLREFALEELPDEIFSTWQSGAASHPDDPTAGRKALAEFLKTLPEFAVATMALGGAGEGISAFQGSRVDQSTPTNRANLPETIATAESAIENMQFDGVDDATLEQMKRRAGVVLSLAQGGELFDVEESDLNAVGWTRDGDTFKPLKDFKGPVDEAGNPIAILDIDKGGRPIIKDAYVALLRKHKLDAVADAIPGTETQTRNRYAQQSASSNQQPATSAPGPQQSQPGPAPATPAGTGGNANPSPVQAPAVNGTQPTSSGQPPAQSGAPVADPASSIQQPASSPDPTAVPTLEKSLADWLVDRYMPDQEAAAAAKALAAHPQVTGKTFDDFNKLAGPQRDALFAELGITGSKALTKSKTDPLRFSGATPSQPASSQSPAKPASDKIEQARKEAEAKAAAAKQKAESLGRPLDPTLPPALQKALDDAIPGQPTKAVFDAINTALTNKEITDAQAAAIVADLTGSKTHTELRQALELKLGWKTTERANAAAANHFGDKSKSDIPLASGDRTDTSNRVPPASSNQPPASSPDPSAARMGPDLSIKSKSPLRKNSAYSRAKLLALARIKDPSKKAWARQAFAALEDSLQRHHTLYDAIAIGPAAIRRLNGAMTAVSEIDGRITRMIDLDAIVANFDYLANPADAIRATGIEEDIHATVLRLARTQPQKYGPEAIRKQWRSLPQALREKVWQAYDYGRSSLPAKLTAQQEYHMQNEFLRMLVQDQAFAQAITETVDTPTSLLQWVRDLLRDLSKTLRDLMGQVDAPLRAELQGMVDQIAAQLRIYEGKSQGTEDRLATLDYLRDPAGIALQAMQSGVLFDHLAKTDPSLTPEAMARAFDLLTPELQSIAYRAYRASNNKEPGTKNKEPKSALLRHLLTAMAGDASVSQKVQSALLSQSPSLQVSKSAPLLSRFVTRLTQRTESPPADLLALLKQQPQKARQTLASLHARLIRAGADLAGARFVQSMPGPVQDVFTAAPPERHADMIAALRQAELRAQAEGKPLFQGAIPGPVLAELRRIAYTAGEANADLALSPNATPEAAAELRKRLMQAEIAARRQRESGLLPTTQDLSDQENTTDEEQPDRASDMAAALENRDRLAEQNRSPQARDALKRRLRAQQYAAELLRERATQELNAARQAGTYGVDKAEAMLNLAIGRIGRRRTGAGWRTISFTERRQLTLLGIGVDQSSSGDQGGYPYTLSRRGMAEARVEFSLEGSPERQTAQEELDWMKEQDADFQTELDDTTAAYVENSRENWTRSLSTQGTDHILIKQAALNDLHYTFPLTANLLRSESDAREGFGLATDQTPRPITQSSRPNENNATRNPQGTAPNVSQEQGETPGQTGSGQSPSMEGGLLPPSEQSQRGSTSEGPAIGAPPVVQNAPKNQPPRKVKIKVKSDGNTVPMDITFQDDLSAAAFAIRPDFDAALLDDSSGKRAQQRIDALVTRIMDDTFQDGATIRKELRAYRAEVQKAAQEFANAPDGTFTPKKFSLAVKTSESAKVLPPPVGGDIISDLKDRVGSLGGPTNTPGTWDWWHALNREADNDTITVTTKTGKKVQKKRVSGYEAQQRIKTGDVTDAATKIAWLLDNGIVKPGTASNIDEAAQALRGDGKTEEKDTAALQQWPVDSGEALGQAILEAIDARIAAKSTDSVQDIESRRAAEDLGSAQDFATYAAGSQGQPFTADQLAKELEIEDEIQIGNVTLTVQDADKTTGTLTLDSGRFGSVTVSGTQTLNLASGPNHLRIGRQPASSIQQPASSNRLAASRAELEAAVAEDTSLSASDRVYLEAIDRAGIQPAISVNGKVYTGIKGMWHPEILAHYVWKNIYTPQQRRNDPYQVKAGKYALEEWMDSRGSGFDDFGYVTTDEGKFLSREEALDHVEQRGLKLPPESYSARHRNLDSSDILSLEASPRLTASQVRAMTLKQVDAPLTREFKGEKAWLFPDGQFAPVDEHSELVSYDPDGEPLQGWHLQEAGIVRIEVDRDDGFIYADHTRSMTLAQRQAVRDTAIERGLEYQFINTARFIPEGEGLAASNRTRDAASSYVEDALDENKLRTLTDLLRFASTDLSPETFRKLRRIHLRNAYNTVMNERGLPEATHAEEADANRTYDPKIERRYGEMPPDLAARDAAIDPALLDQIVGITAPPPNQTDNAASAAADLAALGENDATADAPSIFAVPPAPDAPAMPDTPEERMDAGWNAHPEDEQLPAAPLIAKGDLDAAKPVNIQGGKSSLLARGIYNRAIAALARHAAAIGDMFFGTGTVTQYIHKAGLGKPGGHASEYSPWRASFLRQVTDPAQVETLARGARAGIEDLKRVQEAARDAVTGSTDFPAAMKAFAGFINGLDHSAISDAAWSTIRKRALSGYQTSLKDKDYTAEEFAAKARHFARVHGLKARVMIGMYQALPAGFDLAAYAQKVSAAQAWDKHLLETRSGQTSMFAPPKAEHPGPIPARDDPATTGLYVAAEMLSDNSISLDLDAAGNLNEPFTGLFDDWDWHTSDRAKNIEKLIRDYHQVFVGKTVHSANSWTLLPRLARENPGIGFVIDPPYFGVPETENGRVLIDTATGQPVRKGTSNYDSTTDIRTPDDLLRLFDSFVLPAWQSGAKFVLTNEWDDSAAVALRLRGATVVKIARQGRKGDTPELVAYNFNPNTGELRPHRISTVTPGRAFSALQRGAYPGTSHSGNLDPRLKLAARSAAEAQPEAARMALQQRQNAAQLPRGNAAGGSPRPVGADQRSAPRTPALDKKTDTFAPAYDKLLSEPLPDPVERAELAAELEADREAANERDREMMAEAGIDDSEEAMTLDELEAAERDRQRQFYRDLSDSFDEDGNTLPEALQASRRVHPATGQPLAAANRKPTGPTYPGLKKPTLPAPTPLPELFGEWSASLSNNDLIGYRGVITPGKDNGFGNTEGNGIYLMRKQQEAAVFGKVQRISFPEPATPFLVINDDLYLLQESEDLDQPIDAAKDSPWLQASKYAAQHAHNLGKGKWDAQLAGDILTKLLMESGYDSVYVKGAPDDWVVLLRETRPGQKPLGALKASNRTVEHVEPGFYSALAEAIRAKMPVRSTPATILGTLFASGRTPILTSSRDVTTLRTAKDAWTAAGFPRAMADDIVDRFYKPAAFADIPANAVLLPMPSTSGRNILPDVLAQRIAEQQGATVQTGRVASATARTEAKKKTSFWAKMEDPVGYIPGPDFDALRQAIGPIYLVEDVHNTGESWMAMRRLLEDNGIPVAGVATLTATELRVTSPRDIERLSEKIATLTDTPLDETTELVYGLFHDSYKQWFNKAERIATGDARQAVRLLDAARAHARARATQRNNEAANEGRVQGQGNQDTLAPSYEQLSLSSASRLAESAIQGYLDLPNVNVPASKQPTAKRAIRAAAASTEPYELPASGGSVGNAGKLDALRERAQRTWRGLMDQDVDALKEAFRESDSFSSLLHDFISRGIPRFDIRGAIIENAADFAAFNLAVRTPYFESLKIAILDAANQVVHSQIVHVGGLNEAIADPKVIAGIIATARMLNPKSKLTGWIIAHNHPSGDPSPSDADRRVTRRLLAMGENIGLPLIDHVVTNGERYFSFRESGMIFSSIDDSIDQRPTRSSKPKLPVLPTPTAPFQDNVADYEALPSGSLKTSIFLNAPDKTLPYLQTLRTADPDHYHVLYLDTRLALRAVERIPTSVTLPQLFQRIVLGSAREGGYAFTLGFPATLETTNVVQEDQSNAAAPTPQQRQIVRRLREQSQSIGLVFADAMTHSQERHFSFSEYGLMEEPGALASAPRRARESMNFDPPFKAPFGDILSYSWASKPIGGMQSQRVSDWNNAITNGQTGRAIVHLFKVRKPDGIHTVSLETALGLLSSQDRNRLTSIIRSKQKEMEDEATGQMALFASERLPLSRALQPTTESYHTRLAAANRKVERYKAAGGDANWIIMADLGRWIDWNRYPTLDALKNAAMSDFELTNTLGTPLTDALPYVSSTLADPNNQGNPALRELRRQHGNDPQKLAELLLPKLQEQHRAVTAANADYLAGAHADDPFFQSAMLRATMADLTKSTVAFPVTLYPVAVAETRTAWNEGKLHSLPAMLEHYQQHAKAAAEIALRTRHAAQTVEGLEGGEWMTLPQIPAGATQTEQDAIFATWEALSHPNWCTSRGLARTYAQQGKMAVYRKNGTSLLALRFVGDDVVEVQSASNNGSIPLEYLPEVENYAVQSDSPRTRRTLEYTIENSRRAAEELQKIADDRARFLASIPVAPAPGATWDAKGFIKLADGTYAADAAALQPYDWSPYDNDGFEEGQAVKTNDRRYIDLAYSSSIVGPNIKLIQGNVELQDDMTLPALETVRGNITITRLDQIPALTQVTGIVSFDLRGLFGVLPPAFLGYDSLVGHPSDFDPKTTPDWRQKILGLEQLVNQAVLPAVAVGKLQESLLQKPLQNWKSSIWEPLQERITAAVGQPVARAYKLRDMLPRQNDDDFIPFGAGEEETDNGDHPLIQELAKALQSKPAAAANTVWNHLINLHGASLPALQARHPSLSAHTLKQIHRSANSQLMAEYVAEKTPGTLPEPLSTALAEVENDAVYASNRQRLPLERALAPTTLGASAAFFRPASSNQPPATSRPGQGISALIDSPAAAFTLLQRAFTAAQRGQSSQWLPIRRVWDAFNAQNPVITPAAFMRSVKAADDAGTVLLSPPESATTVEAAGPFKLRNASGIMSTDMMVPLASSDRLTQEDRYEDLKAVRALGWLDETSLAKARKELLRDPERLRRYAQIINLDPNQSNLTLTNAVIRAGQRFAENASDAVRPGLASSSRSNPSQITALRAIFPHANDPSRWTHTNEPRRSSEDFRQRQSLADQFGGETASRPNRRFDQRRIAEDQSAQQEALREVAQEPQRQNQFGLHLDSGGEHAVYISDDDKQVTKITLPGLYGYVPTEDVAPGITGEFRRLKMREATPAEYLYRLALFSRLTGIDWQAHGVETTDEAAYPVIITTQPFVESKRDADGKKIPVTQKQIDAYMASIGFEPLEEMTGTTFRDDRMEGTTYWHPQEQIIAADARPANFNLTPNNKVVPLDLMLAHYPLAAGSRALAASNRQPQITAQNAWALMLAPSAKQGIATNYIDGLKVSLANANTLVNNRAVSPSVRQKAKQDAEQLRVLIPQEEAAWQRIRQQHTPQQLQQIHNDATASSVPLAELQTDLDNLLADFPDASTRPAWATAQMEYLQSEISQSPSLPLSASPRLDTAARAKSLGDRSDRLFMATKRVESSLNDGNISPDDRRQRTTSDTRASSANSPEFISRIILGTNRRGYRSQPPSATLHGNRAAIAEEYQRLTRWAKEQELIFDPSRLGPEKDSRGEHRVYEPAAEDVRRIFKVTYPGLSGLTRRALLLRDGTTRVMEDDALPSEYFDRWALHNEMLDDDTRFEGILENAAGPSIVISQPYIEGTHPAAAPDLTPAGWKQEKGYWTKPHPKEDLLIGLADTKPSNWIQDTETGAVLSVDTIPFIVTDAMRDGGTLAKATTSPASSIQDQASSLPASPRAELAARALDKTVTGLGKAVPTTTAVLKQWLTHHDTTQPVTKEQVAKIAKELGDTMPLPSSKRQPDTGITKPTDAAFVRARVAEWQDAVAKADAAALEAIDLRKKREIADEAFFKAPPEEIDARRAEAMQLSDAEWEAKKKADRFPRAIQGLYIRFGIPPASGRSQNFITSTPDRPRYEKGISTFPITWENGRWQFATSYGTEPSLDALIGRHDRHIYLVTGTVVDEGEDNEPVLGSDYRVLKELTPTEILPPNYGNDPAEWDQSDEAQNWQTLFASPRVETAARALDRTVTGLGQAANLIPKAVGQTIAAVTNTGRYLPGNQALAKLGTQLGELDAAAAAKAGNAIAQGFLRVSGKDIRKAPDAVAAWLNQPAGLGAWAKNVVVDQLLPTAMMPREWLALSHEMQRKAAWGAEKSNDLIRALSGNPRLSDLAYPKEFAENPAYREQLFDAMENKIPMSSLPPAMQALGNRLRQMLRDTGTELVRQGIMHPDTFEELQANGWMPRYMLDEAMESGGSVLAAFKLGVKDLMQQRTTAFHIVDTSRKGKDGQHPTVNRQEGGRNAWRFRDAATRDAFYSDFIRRQALDMLQERHGNDKAMQAMFAPLDHAQRREVRRQIGMLTRADLDTPQKLSPALAGMVKAAIEHQKATYRKENPFDPPKLIKDPVYSIARYVLAQTHNAATMELLNETAKNKEWVSDVSLQGYTEIPDNDRFGPLAGKFVQKDIAAQILDKMDVPNAALRFYDAILRKWKSGKLVWNPGSHIRDAVGNTVFAYLGGSNIMNPGNWPYYRQALEIMRKGGPQYAELIEHGVLGGDAYSSLVRERLKGLLPDAATVENFNPGLIQRLFFDFGAKFHATHEQLAEYRRVPDDFYKIAAYLKAKATFASENPASSIQDQASMAAGHVRKWFPYYDRLGGSATTRAAGRFVNPFFSFFRESTRILGLAAKERPIALSAALAFPAAISALSAMLLGLDDDDRDEIKKDLFGRGKGILGLGGLHMFSMLLPVRSGQGQVQQFDISAIMPFADLLGQKIVPLEEKENAWQTFWRQTAAAGPVGNLAVSWITNRDTFSGRHLTEADMSTRELLGAYTQHAAGVLLPPLLPDAAAAVGIGEGGALTRAGTRQVNKTLATYDPVQTIIRSVFGMNVKSAAPNLYRQADDFRAANGYDAQPGFDYGTTVTSRAKRLLVAQLAQDEPNPTAIKNLVRKLKELGVPMETEGDVNKTLSIIDPAALIGGSKKAGITAETARQRFRQSLPPESRQLYETALSEYQRIKQRAPLLVRQAASL
jgi:DNA repair protein RadC